jgi:hypothetical protein
MQKKFEKYLKRKQHKYNLNTVKISVTKGSRFQVQFTGHIDKGGQLQFCPVKDHQKMHEIALNLFEESHPGFKGVNPELNYRLEFVKDSGTYVSFCLKETEIT